MVTEESKGSQIWLQKLIALTIFKTPFFPATIFVKLPDELDKFALCFIFSQLIKSYLKSLCEALIIN